MFVTSGSRHSHTRRFDDTENATARRNYNLRERGRSVRDSYKRLEYDFWCLGALTSAWIQGRESESFSDNAATNNKLDITAGWKSFANDFVQLPSFEFAFTFVVLAHKHNNTTSEKGMYNSGWFLFVANA